MPRKIIIIGASSGIGREMAEQYISRGDTVGITGRRKELLEELKAQYPAQVHTSSFDVTSPGVTGHLQQLIDEMGGVDIVVISAGNGEPSEQLSWEIDKMTIDTNINGFAAIANYAFNYFINLDHGQLAVISSVAARRGGFWAPAYNASKAFQSSYCYGLSLKASRLSKNVFVTCVEPGFVKTKMAKSEKLFWVIPLNKAARQIIHAIDRKKRKAYISKRWWLVAKLLEFMPHSVYKKIS